MGVELLEHNQSAYDEVKKLYEQGNRAAVIHPTGSGKSFIALKLIEENKDKKVVYLSSGVPILNQLKRDIIASDVQCEQLKRMTYQKLTKMDEAERTDLEADIIVLDEFHHCGAPEWGKAVEELLSNNPNAKVLGLSATPMRYYDDSIRDMAEELFDNCVASEMSLEEAITSRILPEPEYTAGFYEYGEIISELEEKINKCTEPEKKRLAEEEIEKLRNMLEASVNGLPELLKNSMTNKSGRYIVYCRDIEDMQKKMSEAQKMFGKVNPNMEIMSVSSSEEDIRKNASTIRKFEKDSDDEKLKLLFSVNMLNEGYHLPKLDGVIMMRPTHSPTLYYQQLGRAMTVGEGKKPVIIDLVNNIDSIEIIQNFSKSLEQERRKRNKTESKSRIGFSISKETRNVEEVVRKIEDLVKRERTVISNEEKLRLMLEYMEKTGEKISADTQYEGYNIGHYKANLRAMYRNGTLNISDELLQKFIESGIIVEGKERRDQTTQQEKYEFLMQMVGKTPEEIASARMRNGMSVKEALGALRVEVNRGSSSLTQEQIKELKTVKFLKLSSEEKSELAQKYGLPEKYAVKADEIWNSREEFIKAFKTAGDISENSSENQLFKEISEIKQSDFFHGPKIITISSKEITERQKLKYAKLLSDVFAGLDINNFNDSYYFDIDGVDESISTLTQRENKIIKMRYGLDGDKTYTLEEIGEEFHITRERGRVFQAKALRKLGFGKRADKMMKNLSQFDELDKENSTLSQELQDKLKAEKRRYDIARNFYINEEDIFNPDSIIPGIEREQSVISSKQPVVDEEKIIKEKHLEDISIEDLDLKLKHATSSLRRAGIMTLADLMSKDEKELEKIEGLGSSSCFELCKKRELFKRAIISKDIDPENINTREMGFRSGDTRSKLYGEGIRNLADFMSRDEEELMQIKGIYKEDYADILKKRKLYGLILKLNNDEEKEKIDEESYDESKYDISNGSGEIESDEVIQLENVVESNDKLNEFIETPDVESLSDEELDNFLEQMNKKNQEQEAKLERLRKIKRAKDLIKLNMEQDKEIAELESQMKGIDIDD